MHSLLVVFCPQLDLVFLPQPASLFVCCTETCSKQCSTLIPECLLPGFLIMQSSTLVRLEN